METIFFSYRLFFVIGGMAFIVLSFLDIMMQRKVSEMYKGPKLLKPSFDLRAVLFCVLGFLLTAMIANIFIQEMESGEKELGGVFITSAAVSVALFAGMIVSFVQRKRAMLWWMQEEARIIRVEEGDLVDFVTDDGFSFREISVEDIEHCRFLRVNGIAIDLRTAKSNQAFLGEISMMTAAKCMWSGNGNIPNRKQGQRIYKNLELINKYLIKLRKAPIPKYYSSGLESSVTVWIVDTQLSFYDKVCANPKNYSFEVFFEHIQKCMTLINLISGECKLLVQNDFEGTLICVG